MNYPFSAVVGMAEMRLALLLNAVAPEIGGVLVRGEKGTAKSTMVRALATLLPSLEVVEGCRFNCGPMQVYPECPDGPHDAPGKAEQRPARLVELPVGATEDRLVGSLDLERALSHGQAAYEPGLLAAAHRGVLYVDEVNLLHDHLVDLLLDAAAMGEAYVERDGVSIRHAARFLLVGTMNPEEGELRPQLLDRFGLAVQVAAPRDPQKRTEVVRRRLAHEADPAEFAARWAEADAELAERIIAARKRLPEVKLPEAELTRIAHVCAALEVDGLRADIVVARTARALAAWHDRDVVLEDDVRTAARLALPHRQRRDPFDAPELDEDKLDDAFNSAPPPDNAGGSGNDGASDDGDGDDEPPGGPGGGGGPDDTGGPDAQGPSRERTDPPAESPRARALKAAGLGAGPEGKRSAAYTRTGRTAGSRPPAGPLTSLHLAATVRAAAPHQATRGRQHGGRLLLRGHDLREPVRHGRESNLVLFCVDASGSMAARQRMSAVKGAVLALLRDAYQRRDKVGLITFRGADAELVLPPTSSVLAGVARLRQLPTGGRTPLAAGLRRAGRTLRAERLRDPQRRALLIVVTDGRATWGSVDDALKVARSLVSWAHGVVVDCESGPVRLGLAAALARELHAEHVPLAELTADGLVGVSRA